MEGSTTTGAKRRGPHRAVVAIQQAALNDPLRGSSPIISSEKPYRDTVSNRPVIRYASFEALAEARRQPDPFIEMRQELESMLEKPKPVNELDSVKDEMLLRVMGFLGHASRDAVVFASTCRRLRALSLSKCCLSEVHIVPDMLSLEEYSITDRPEQQEGTPSNSNNTSSTQGLNCLTSIAHFYHHHKRGQHVHSLSLVESKYASTLPITATFPTTSIHKTLSLVGELPWLTELDVRSVVWSSASNSMIAYFLSDLHLVAPQLHTLKMGVELYNSWTPGWWQRHSELCSVVVASRREQPAPLLDVPHPTVPLHSDLLVMLQSDRPWKLKVWSAMDETSLRKILFPAVAFQSLTELTLNVLGCSPLSSPPDPMDLTESKKGKGVKRPATADDGDALAFPRLTSLTIANVDENPMLAVELYGKFAAQAPRLSFFSVCNTVKYPPPERLKGRRRLAAAAAAAAAKAA